MLVYLDSRDLINLLERSELGATDELRERLHSGGHRLAVSFALIAELSAPLQYPNAKTNVMALLGRLEQLPLEFIADLKLEYLELSEALEAWAASRECHSVDPFVPRIDYTLPFAGVPPTYLQLTSSIPENVFRLWTNEPGIFNGHIEHVEELRKKVTKDRALPKLPNLRGHFPGVLASRLDDFGLAPPSDLISFANWLYDKPERCPSARLSLEVYRAIVRNRTYTPEASLFEDCSHLKCLPYVDVITLDKHMAGCVKQACAAARLPYAERVYTDADEVVQLLN